MNQEQLKKIEKEINNQIGDKSFQKLLEIKRLSEETNDILRDKKYLEKDGFGKLRDGLTLLSEKLEEVRDKEIPEYPTEVSVTNFPTIKTQIVKFPENLKELKNTDLGPLTKAILETNKATTEAITKALARISLSNRNPDEAIPVRVVVNNKGQKQFLNDFGGDRGWGPEVFHTGVKNESGEEDYLRINENNELKVDATLSASDIQIGAVEIKDGDSAARLDVETDSTKNAAFVQSESLALETGGNLADVKTNTDTPSTLVAFVTDIPTAGTRVQLASNAIKAGIVQAPSTNTGNVYIGGSTVSSTVFGAELQPGQSTGIAIDNTNKIYIDAASNGDDVAFIGS